MSENDRPKQLKVAARPAGGFRRAGRHWPAEEVTVDAGQFSDHQLDQLRAEPNLVVTEISDGGSGGKGKSGGQAKGGQAADG